MTNQFAVLLAVIAACLIGCAATYQVPGGSVDIAGDYSPPTAITANVELDYDLAELACKIPYADTLIDCDVPEAGE